MEFAGCVIVEKEKRLRPLDHEIVHRHGHQVDAHRIVAAGIDGNPELGAHAVIGGDEHRILEAAGGKIEKPAETAQGRIRACPFRRCRQRPDHSHEFVSGIDIDTGLRIAIAVRAVLRGAWGHVGIWSLSGDSKKGV